MRRDKSILYSRIVIKTILIITFITYNNLYLNSLNEGISLYSGLFKVNSLTQNFSIFILIVSAMILTLGSFYNRKLIIKNNSSIYNILFKKIIYNKTTISNKTGEQFRIIEYPLIIVFIICGALFLISTSDLISIFLSIELQSYGLYILSTLYRDSESSTASGLTYFLLGGLSSCFILLGSALLYANSGTTNLENIYVIASISEIEPITNDMYKPYYFHLSLIIISVGLLFKVSAAPFHFWSPDVYDGIPTIVTTYVAIIAKISIFAFFIELVYYTESSFFDFNIKSIFVLSSLFSLIIGSVLGLTQFRIKRLFAYSTISHVGFILLALSINTTESVQSYIFYILQYSISNLNAFIILITIGFSLYMYVNSKELQEDTNLTEKNNSPVQLISQLKGYFYINPYLALSLAITLFSFVGIPPITGFFAKQMILSAALDNGYVFMSLIAVLTSVIGAGYYLNLIKQIFFFKHNYKINPATEDIELSAYIIETPNNNEAESSIKTKIQFNKTDIKINSSLSVIITILTFLLLLFIYMSSEWFNIVSIITLVIFRA